MAGKWRWYSNDSEFELIVGLRPRSPNDRNDPFWIDDAGQYYWWDETQTGLAGPFPTVNEANEVLVDYCTRI